MFGTTTLAEVKKKLIAQFGYLPDFSAMISSDHNRALQPTNEIERNLASALAELERMIEQELESKMPDGGP